MPINTGHGKAYSVDELLKLGSIGGLGNYNNAIMGALQENKTLRAKTEAQEKELTQLKSLLGEALQDKFLSEVRKESGNRKDK